MPTLCEELTERFLTFCASFEHAEAIDNLGLTDAQRKAKKADFFFAERRVVCEIKSLETETNDKLVRQLLKAGVRLSPGTFELTQVISDRPDKDALYRTCVNTISTAVSDGLAEANRQIRVTKQVFGIDRADGLVVLLHGRVHVLNPDVIMLRVGQRLKKMNPDGSGPAHEHITGVLLFSEIHKLKLLDGSMAAAALPVVNPKVPDHFGISTFMDTLIGGWANWNGRRKHVIPASALRE